MNRLQDRNGKSRMTYKMTERNKSCREDENSALAAPESLWVCGDEPELRDDMSRQYWQSRAVSAMTNEPHLLRHRVGADDVEGYREARLRPLRETP